MSTDSQPRYTAEEDTAHLAGIHGLGAVEAYLGDTLAQALPKHGIRRALDIGVGYDFTTMKQLAAVLAPDDLLAIDPALWDDGALEAVLAGYQERFRRQRISAEELRDQVRAGVTEPFDLIICKGVMTSGWFGGRRSDPQEWMKQSQDLLAVMKDCLNPGNPNALIMAETKTDGVLLVSRPQVEAIGLDIAYHLPSRNTTWLPILREKKILPSTPQDGGYRLVLCKSKPQVQPR